MTHDLLNSMISSLHAEVKQVTINDLKDNTFFAMISVVQNGSDMTIDARPSDAIALALRTKSPIFVEEKVIEAAKELDLPDPNKIQNDEKKQWEDWITGIKPQDFGKL